MSPQGRIVGEGPETRISSRPSSRIIAESTTSTVALPRRRRRTRRWDCPQLGAKRSQVDRARAHTGAWRVDRPRWPAIRRDQRGDSLRHQHRRPPGVRKQRALLTIDKHGNLIDDSTTVDTFAPDGSLVVNFSHTLCFTRITSEAFD